ncbi:hypothetical protein [Comamonas sp. C24C]
MRDYGVVSPKFWIGETGKSLRGNAAAQVLALYLMTCPHANMIGVFHCPVLYMAHETGLGMEGASKALASLIEAKYCTYDEASETVFVHRMAAFQIGESLAAADKRCKGVEREWQNISCEQLKQAFFAMYSVAFHLPKLSENASPFEAPSKPHASQEQEQEQEQDIDAPSAKSPRGTSLSAEWALPDDWKTWAQSERPDLDVISVADSFRDYWIAKPGKDGRKADWKATWRNWVRNQRRDAPRFQPPSAGQSTIGRFV